MGGKAKRAIKAVATGGLSELAKSAKPPKAPQVDIPQPITPAGVPTMDEARQVAEKNDQLRRRRGRASTILTGQSGDVANVNVGTKTLLGG